MIFKVQGFADRGVGKSLHFYYEGPGRFSSNSKPDEFLTIYPLKLTIGLFTLPGELNLLILIVVLFLSVSCRLLQILNGLRAIKVCGGMLLEEKALNANLKVDLSGKTALVTGGASGVGYGIARVLSQAGARVLVNDLLPDRTREAALKLNGEPFPGDITDPGFIRKVNEEKMDILVNNAGFQHVSPLESFPPEVFRRMLEVQLVGPFLLCQAVVPGMKERGFGRIINIGSVHSKIASAYKAAYVTAKHGLMGLTRVLAVETALCGITVNAICPGYVDTPLVRNQLKDLAASHNLPEDKVITEVILRPVPIKRLLDPEEVGYLALFLCSDAAAFITAQGYTIDGGWSQI